MKQHLLIHTTLITALLATTSFARTWWNPDRSRSFDGDFVSLTGKMVKIQRDNGKVVDLTLDRLHTDDQAWIKQHMLELQKDLEEQAARSVFANLNFGDSKDTVLKKLKRSPLVTTDMDERLLGRTGLNGLFHTKAKLGDQTCTLYFDWTRQERLKEITLRTQPIESSDYSGKVKSCWGEMVELVGSGPHRNVQKIGFPLESSMAEGISLNTHLWRLKHGGSALVGVGMENGKYLVTTRFTKETVSTGR